MITTIMKTFWLLISFAELLYGSYFVLFKHDITNGAFWIAISAVSYGFYLANRMEEK